MKRFRLKKKSSNSPQWRLVLKTNEEALNLYSVLWNFRSEQGSRVLNDEALGYVQAWLNRIERAVPNIQTLAEDVRGPFREKDRAQIQLVIPLDAKERELMLFIWKLIYQQLLQPADRARWIENQGQADYDLAIENYRSWITTLEQ